MKTIDRLFQETEIHFLLQNEGEVMVNATEMAKVFGKKSTHFLENETTKNFIQSFIKAKNEKIKSRNSDFLEEEKKEDSPFISEKDVVFSRQKSGTFMRRELAIYFAMWLDPDFAVWVIEQIDGILFGHYKKHWEAHAKQEDAKERMNLLRTELLSNPTTEKALAYFEAEREANDARNAKTRAIKNQYKLL